MRRLRTLVIVPVILTVLGPAGVAPPAATAADGLPPLADVPFYRADALRSSIEIGPGPTAEPELAWEHVLDAGANTDPILVGGLLIVGDQDGHLVAIDARTGRETWRATGDGAFAGAPASAAGIVVAADATAIRGFDASTGQERWVRDVASDAPRLAIVDRVVYVGTVDGAVRGLDLESGADRWSWQGDHSLSVRVDLVADGVVYANPNDGRLLAIEMSDGSERWRYLSRASRVAYGLAADTVFLTNPVTDDSGQGGQIAAIDAATGQVRWRFVGPSGDQVAAGPFRDGILYVDSHADGIYALRDDGDAATIVWHTDAPTMYRVLTLVGDTLYGATEDGTLLALRADDGTSLWTSRTVGSHVMPIISGGMLFTVDAAGDPRVRAFAERDLIAQLPPPASPVRPSPPPVAGLVDPFAIVRSTPDDHTGVTVGSRRDGPEGVTMEVGPDGLLYVGDPTDHITVVDPSTGLKVRQFGGHGSDDGRFHEIKSLAIDSDGSVYVVDRQNHRVQVLDSNGGFTRQIGGFGSDPGQFVRPFMLTLDPGGAVYVLDGDSREISKFDPMGAFVWRVGGALGDPALRGAYDLTTMKDGSILVMLDPGGPATLLDPADGSVVGRWGDASIGGSGEPTVDGVGNVFLFQYVPAAMRVFDAAGQPLGIREYTDDDESAHRFYPTPVFALDGFGYSFNDNGDLLRLKVTLP